MLIHKTQYVYNNEFRFIGSGVMDTFTVIYIYV